ncbi:hypothetical protein ACOME3_003900 [Neoechinorhynchus agilis]
MVCKKCTKKLGKVITPDPWKLGARNTTESGGRIIGENKLVTQRQARFNPYTREFPRCKLCRSVIHQVGSKYCHACAFKRGICSMCGSKLYDTSRYQQNSA